MADSKENYYSDLGSERVKVFLALRVFPVWRYHCSYNLFVSTGDTRIDKDIRRWHEEGEKGSVEWSVKKTVCLLMDC